MHQIENNIGHRIGYQYKAIGWIAACFFPGIFLVLGATQKGYVSFTAWMLFFLVAAAFGTRLVQEYRIINDPANILAVVTALRRRPLEAGHVYSVRYRFTTEDGKDYIGSSGWTREKLSAEGEPIEILYRRTHPSHNLPLCDFRFYQVHL